MTMENKISDETIKKLLNGDLHIVDHQLLIFIEEVLNFLEDEQIPGRENFDFQRNNNEIQIYLGDSRIYIKSGKVTKWGR